MITLIVELSCDSSGCDVAYVPAITELTSIRATRVGSLIAGWTHDGRRDFCPDHKPVSRTPEPSRAADVRSLAEEGLTDDRIAARLDLSRAVVFKVRHDNDIPPGIGRPGRPRGAATGSGRRG